MVMTHACHTQRTTVSPVKMREINVRSKLLDSQVMSGLEPRPGSFDVLMQPQMKALSVVSLSHHAEAEFGAL